MSIGRWSVGQEMQAELVRPSETPAARLAATPVHGAQQRIEAAV